ncbi:hypothetical protein F2Q69_00006944 [Brassica cretica]|uniref:Uncharacterized protein n=1 Tax=Brassica cretica TaxID=69181 RepID=A0A8S9NT28_BRACR|nr:hypothetical protein F2Q69_00006944 [Brassica cretica]
MFTKKFPYMDCMCKLSADVLGEVHGDISYGDLEVEAYTQGEFSTRSFIEKV